ncbi:hypothetical protein VTP01DRAFT_8951 [Rhizomucor pusillus]|uniref:uncharacterized protein n=1 Tax=Rhizomucor pusillus TaxID=4840 RepID=UPI0037446D4E
MSRKSRKGALAPMDHKVANALYRKIKQRNRRRDSTNADIATRVDEYLSSKMCCYCTKQGREQRVDFLQRTPVVPVRDAARLDDGHEKTIWRLLHSTCYGSKTARAGSSGHQDVKEQIVTEGLRRLPVPEDVVAKERLRRHPVLHDGKGPLAKRRQWSNHPGLRNKKHQNRPVHR